MRLTRSTRATTSGRAATALIAVSFVIWCAGTPGHATASQSEVSCSGVYWRTLRNGPQLCPRTHSLLSDVSLVHLRWQSWGGASAVGHGSYSHTVYPNGHLGYYLAPVTVTLSRPRRCPDGVRIYSRFDYVEFSPRAHRRIAQTGWTIPCDGETGGGNG